MAEGKKMKRRKEETFEVLYKRKGNLHGRPGRDVFVFEASMISRDFSDLAIHRNRRKD